MTEGARQVLSTWEELRFEAEEYRELDGERVLVLIRASGRGKASGLEYGEIQSILRPGAHLFHVRADKVTRLVVYFDCERAFADLGLAPEAGSARP